MITELYQRELRALKEKAREFSKKYPAFAGHLGDESADPDVERILEGVAFLGAGIQEKLDSGFPHFAQSLLDLIAPQYLQEIPSTTIIEFQPKNVLKTKIDVPEGTFIDSVEVGGTKCRFSTCTSMTMYPLAIDRMYLETRGDDKAIFKMEFGILEGARCPVDLTSLKFLVSGSYLDASNLFHVLTSHQGSITLKDGDSEQVLSGYSLEPVGTLDEFTMLEQPEQTLPSYRMLTEYFVNKSKFLYFQLRHISGKELVTENNQFTLEIELNNLRGRMPRVSNDSVRIFTTPAINLFDHESEPVQYEQHDSEVMIKPLRNTDGQFSVHSIDQVVGHNRQNGQKREYFPLSLVGKASAGGLEGTKLGYGIYETVRKPESDKDLVNHHLTLSYPQGTEIPEKETLTAKLKCSNGSLAGDLNQGDVCKATLNTSELVKFSNIMPPTTYVPARTGDVVWSLLSHLNTNYLTIANGKNLKSLLSLYLPQSTSDRREESANLKRLESVQEVSVESVDKLFRGTLVRGQRVSVTLDGVGFAGLGDIFIFGGVLHKLFKDFASVNSFVELQIIDTNSGEELAWKAQLGNHLLI